MEKKDIKQALLIIGGVTVAMLIVVPSVTYGYEKWVKPKLHGSSAPAAIK